MDINATLIGQMLTFAIFIWVTLRYVWPPITQAIETRTDKIAEGLKAADAGQAALVKAQAEVAEMMQAAKQEVSELLAKAQTRGDQLIDAAKETAQQEQARIVARAQADIQQQLESAKQQLTQDSLALAVKLSEKILQKTIQADGHQQLFDQLITDMES